MSDCRRALECKDIVEEPATVPAKEESTHSWRGGDVRTSTTPGSGAPQTRKERRRHTLTGSHFFREPLGRRSLKQEQREQLECNDREKRFMEKKCTTLGKEEMALRL